MVRSKERSESVCVDSEAFMHYAVMAVKLWQAFCRRIIDADLPELPPVAARFWHLLGDC